jgi:hydrogenase-4 component E
MRGLAFDVAHLLAGTLVLVSFLELYQDRLYALLNMFALHALVLALSVAWQAYIQNAPHLYVTAAIALIFKAIIIPVALHRIIVRLGIHREIEKVVGVGSAMLLGMGLVALSMVVMLRVTAEADPLAREDLAFALAVVLLGLLMMVTRRNAVSQIVGFMSLENGLVLAATGAKGMPLVVEISIAFSILIAFIVIGIFLFRIRERFDTVDLQALDQFRGGRADDGTVRTGHRRSRNSSAGGGTAGGAAGVSADGDAQRHRDVPDLPRRRLAVLRPPVADPVSAGR